MNEEVLELVKKQENYRSDLVRLMSGGSIDDDEQVIYEISQILLDVNLITKEIRSMEVDDGLHELYAELIHNINYENYMKCSKLNEKIKNYNATS